MSRSGVSRCRDYELWHLIPDLIHMPKKQRRDNAYYKERLKTNSQRYADLQVGKHKTITETAIMAGLKKSRTRLHEMKNAFGKAGKSEQSAFSGVDLRPRLFNRGKFGADHCYLGDRDGCEIGGPCEETNRRNHCEAPFEDRRHNS